MELKEVALERVHIHEILVSSGTKTKKLFMPLSKHLKSAIFIEIFSSKVESILDDDDVSLLYFYAPDFKLIEGNRAEK